MNLSYWLRKSPQPKVVLADDKRIDVPRNGRAWRDLTETIKALEPEKLTCLDEKDHVIRSVVLTEKTADDDDKSHPSAEMSDLQLFATLLAEGYAKGMTANQPVIDNAMQFVERQGVRLAKAEAEIERLRSHIHKLNIQIAELNNQPPPTEDQSILGALVSGAIQSGALSMPAPTPTQDKVVTPIKGGQKK